MVASQQESADDVNMRLIGVGCLALGLLMSATQAPAQAPPSGPLSPSMPSGIGVWYQPGAPASEQLWRPGDPGERLILRGRILGTDARPIASAQVELWHADANGEVHADRYRTTLKTRKDGSFRVSTVLPGYIWGPRHIHVVVSTERPQPFITRLFFYRDPELADSNHPGVSVFLEDGVLEDRPALFGRVDLVLP